MSLYVGMYSYETLPEFAVWVSERALFEGSTHVSSSESEITISSQSSGTGCDKGIVAGSKPDDGASAESA